MLLRPRSRAPWIVLILVLCPVALPTSSAQDSSPFDEPLPAGDAGRAGHGQFGFHLGYYDGEDDHAANPFLDESLTVVEPVVFFNYNLSNSTNIWTNLSYDYVSSASIARLDDYEVTAATGDSYIAQSGASGDNYYGVELGLLHHWSDTLQTDIYGSFSKEYDYQSIGIGGDVAMSVADQDATLGGSLRLFFDEVDVILFDGNEEGSENRYSVATTLSWYQIMTPLTHGTFGLTVGYQEGFLETPYNAVVIEDPLLPPNEHLENMASGIETSENLPGTRTRVAAYARVRHSLTDAVAAEIFGRIYTDTWGIDSLTITPRLYHRLVPDQLRLRFSYRFYVQDAADAYDEQFTTVRHFRTQDSDLGDFSSHTFGVQLRWYWSETQRIDIGGDYIFRSDSLDQLIASLGWSYDF